MKRLFRFILILVLASLVGSWLIPAAYGQINNGSEHSGIQVEAAPPEASPVVNFWGNAIGGVSGGDLFYVNASDTPVDFSLELYITNSNELIHYLKYLILKVGIYVEDADGQWNRVTSQNSEMPIDTYITLKNSPVNYILPGTARYKITIESGSYHSFPFFGDSPVISPAFYLNAETVLWGVWCFCKVSQGVFDAFVSTFEYILYERGTIKWS